MMRTTPRNHHGLDYQKGKFNENHKKINGLGEDQEKDRVLVIKDSITKDKNSIFSTENDKNLNWSEKKNLKRIFSIES